MMGVIWTERWSLCRGRLHLLGEAHDMPPLACHLAPSVANTYYGPCEATCNEGREQQALLKDEVLTLLYVL